MKRFIVTGATGFLGRSFIDLLLNQDEKVTVIVKDGKRAHEMWGDSVDIFERNITDLEDGDISEFVDADEERIMVHFAWAGTSGENRASEKVQLENISMSAKLVRFSKEIGCSRFVNAGSIMEYESMLAMFKDGLRPSKNSIYSIAKLSADFMMKAIASDIDIDYVNVIISNIYGPGENSKRFLNSTIRALINDEPIKLTEGLQTYDFIYIDDAVNMIKTVAERGKPFESYYIGNKTQRTLREYVITAKKTIESKSELLFGAIPFEGQALTYNEFDCSKIGELGIDPKVSFEEGISRTKDWIVSEMIMGQMG